MAECQKGKAAYMTTFDITQTIFNFFAMLYLHHFMQAFFDNVEKRKPRWLWCLYFAYPIFTSVVYFWMNYPIVNLAANIAALFVISLQYRASFWKRITAVGLTFFCMIALESVCAAATNYIGASAFQTGTYGNIPGLVVTNLLTFMTSLIVCHLKNMRKSVSIPKRLWLMIAGIPITSIAAILLILHYSDITQSMAVVVIVVFLFINGYTFYLYDALVSTYNAKLQATLLEEEKECYYNQCQYMQQSEQELSAFRHDIRNQLDMIYSLLKQDPGKEVVECISKIEQKFEENTPFSQTDQIALDSILNLKLSQARQKNIQVSCNSSVPHDLKLDASDMMVILGNLLDNAITAASQKTEGAFISVQVSYEKGMLFITVENSYSGKLREWNGHFLTTKSNREQHGYGLHNIKKVLEPYHGIMEFEHTDHVFTVNIVMYCTPSKS